MSEPGKSIVEASPTTICSKRSPLAPSILKLAAPHKRTQHQAQEPSTNSGQREQHANRPSKRRRDAPPTKVNETWLLLGLRGREHTRGSPNILKESGEKRCWHDDHSARGPPEMQYNELLQKMHGKSATGWP
mmetsp:Transcript_689/g.1231  ORF Transcript_689/g.1231 Transcript_689/m.1231 type:complete len:132 (-) Transcript_689:310-705(-)